MMDAFKEWWRTAVYGQRPEDGNLSAFDRRMLLAEQQLIRLDARLARVERKVGAPQDKET
jgi:hypothetical protein